MRLHTVRDLGTAPYTDASACEASASSEHVVCLLRGGGKNGRSRRCRAKYVQSAKPLTACVKLTGGTSRYLKLQARLGALGGLKSLGLGQGGLGLTLPSKAP